MKKEIINSIKNKLSKEEIDFILKNDVNLKDYFNLDNIGRKRVCENVGYYAIELGISNFIHYYYDNQEFDGNNFNNYNYFENEVDAQKYAKLVINYLKVLQTLDYINGDWKPDWNNEDEDKCVIEFYRGDINNDINHYSPQILSFQSEEKRQQFRQLITDEEIKLFLNPLGEI